jgi:putative spermidine/putrescine transport system permease protein
MENNRSVSPKKKINTVIARYCPYALFLPFLIFVAMFELLPLLTMVIRSFTVENGSGFTLENYLSGIFQRPAYRAAIKNTLELSFYSAVIGLFIVFIAAAILANAKHKMQSKYMMLLTVTSHFTGVPLVFAFISILGTLGVFVLIGKQLNIGVLGHFDLYTKTGLLLTYIYFQIPLGTLIMIPAFEAIHPEWKESASLLQASPFQFWWKVGIPVLIPSIAGTFSILFANAVSSFATPYTLLNNFPLMTISIAGLFVADVRPKPNLGSAFSIIMLFIIIAVILLTNLIKKVFAKGAVQQ